MSGTGFIYQTHINLEVLIFGAIGIVIFIVLLSILAARKVKKISPVQAIGKGKAPVYFSNRLNVSIDKLSFLPFTLRLSLKQIITNLRQYVAIILMSVFLIFSMITMMNVKQEFTEKNVLKLVGVQDADIWIRYKEYDDKMNDEILSFIEKEDGIENEFMEGNTYLTIENLRVFSASMNNYDTSTIQPVEGRWPKYKNEVSITKVVADSIDKELGDTVMMRYKDGEEKEYIISGYHQTMNELGKYIFLSEEGIQQLDESYEENSVSIDLKDESKTNELVDKLKDTFNDDNIDVVNLQENMGFQSEVVVGAVQSVANGVNIFAIGLVAIVVLLISSICMEREKMDLGVMRAQGFTVRQLRMMFTLRFTTVVLVSGVVSLFISLLVSDWLLSQALSIAGVSHFSSEIGFENTFLPILLITGFIFVFSYVVTRKIKKVNVVKLIKE
jgi:ABC-type antimicrobial peptide transport system permease subunit